MIITAACQAGRITGGKKKGFSFALQKRGAMNTSPGGACKVESHGELNAVLQETLNWPYIYLKAPSQKRLIKRMTELVEKAAPEHCNAPCCSSLTRAEECSGTLKFRQHCLRSASAARGTGPCHLPGSQRGKSCCKRVCWWWDTTGWIRRANKPCPSLHC